MDGGREGGGREGGWMEGGREGDGWREGGREGREGREGEGESSQNTYMSYTTKNAYTSTDFTWPKSSKASFTVSLVATLDKCPTHNVVLHTTHRQINTSEKLFLSEKFARGQNWDNSI